jgi:hypothetical protein
LVEDMVDHIWQLVKPPATQGCEDDSFAGYLRVQYVVKGADPIGGDYKQAIGVLKVRC